MNSDDIENLYTPKRSYPYFGKNNGDVVFFTGPRTGYCFESTSGMFKPMYFSTGWCEVNFQKMEISGIELQEKISTIISHKITL